MRGADRVIEVDADSRAIIRLIAWKCWCGMLFELIQGIVSKRFQAYCREKLLDLHNRIRVVGWVQ